jgi:hypothetical protein
MKSLEVVAVPSLHLQARQHKGGGHTPGGDGAVCTQADTQVTHN